MIYDLAIIGGGPAGVAAGVYAARKNLRTVFITKDWESQSVVSEGIENWIGTIKIPGHEFAKSMENHLRAYAKDAVDIKVGESVEKIEAGFKIKTNKAEYEAKTVLITTGSMRKKLEVKGADIFEHKGLTYCASCDGPLFGGQDVVVIGGGNAGFESAAQLLAYCKSVTLLNRSETFRADPVTVEKVSQHPNFKIVKNANIQEVLGEKFVTGIKYNDTILPTAAIFVEIGSIPTTYFAKDLVTMTPNNNIVVDPRTQRTSAEGIWAAGDCTDGLYHQNNIAAGDAVKARQHSQEQVHLQ
jgi:alkyl hydroperoxide reductase subunit F